MDELAFLDLFTLWPSLILITVDLYSYQLGISSAELCILVNGVSNTSLVQNV